MHHTFFLFILEKVRRSEASIEGTGSSGRFAGLGKGAAAMSVSEEVLEAEEFFSKGQPCLRTSPLAKTYGWAFHFDHAGKIALVPMDSEQLDELIGCEETTVRSAMRASR